MSTNVGGLPELITSGRNGLLVDPGDDKRWTVQHMAETTEAAYRQWSGERAER